MRKRMEEQRGEWKNERRGSESEVQFFHRFSPIFDRCVELLL